MHGVAWSLNRWCCLGHWRVQGFKLCPEIAGAVTGLRIKGFPKIGDPSIVP